MTVVIRTAPETGISETAEILLVQDSVELALLLGEVIRCWKPPHRVTVASDGEEALAVLRRRGKHALAPRPHLVLLDWNLPGDSGRGALKAIRSDPAARSLLVVVLTGSESERDVRECYDLGANAFVHLPTDLHGMERTIHATLDFWLGVVRQPPVPAP
ncbi:MAG: response regulator [Candidatus Riflebacteria bacterium]|nr:response regulator [Candidatus Riflebacteria bacterium]